MKTKLYTEKMFKGILSYNGWKYVRSNGDHDIYEKEGHPKHISIPSGKKTLNAMLTRRIIKEEKLKII